VFPAVFGLRIVPAATLAALSLACALAGEEQLQDRMLSTQNTLNALVNALAVLVACKVL